MTALLPERQPDGRPSEQLVASLRQHLLAGEAIDHLRLEWQRPDGSTFIGEGKLSVVRMGERLLAQAHGNPVPDAIGVDELLEQLAHALSGTTEQAFFETLALQLNRLLNCADVMIARLIEGPPRRLASLARVIDGRIEGAVEMLLLDHDVSPAGAVMNGKTCVYSGNLQSQFPGVAYWRDQRLNSYIGIPVKGTAGKVIGIITLIDRKPFPDPMRVEYLLEIFAGRIGAEVERQAANTALVSSEERLRLAMKAARIWTWEWDPHRDWLRVEGPHETPSVDGAQISNEAMADWLARRGEKQAETLRHALAQAVQQNEPVRFDYTTVDSRGLTHHMDSAGARQCNESGQVERIVGATWDITEQVEQRQVLHLLARGGPDVSEMLAEAVSALAGILHARFAGVVCVDNQDSAYAVSRARYADGRSAELGRMRLAGTLIEYVINSGVQTDVENVRDSFPEDESGYHPDFVACMAYPLRRADGTVFGVLYLGDSRPIPLPAWSRSVLEVVAVRLAAEIERHDTLLALEASRDELEQRVATRTRELEDFCYSVSHDLRQPLRGLDGFSQALLDDSYEQLDAISREHLNRIRAGAQRMSRIIDDLLGLAKLTHRKLKPVPVNLSELAFGIVQGLREEQPTRAVEFVIGADMTTSGDPELLGAALEHLLGNAWKFTRDRSPARIAFGVDSIDDDPVFFVSDNGVGFDMRYADKLFGAFQQLHAPGDFEGSGIGLATARRIINRHGGHIWAEAKPGEGATFFFTLPS